MKRFTSAALAAAVLVAPLGVSSVAAADPPRNHRDGRGDRCQDRDHNRDRDCGYRNGRNARHDNGLHRGWDRQQHNGYSYNGRWHYGPPPAAYYNDSRYTPAYRQWRRGDRLPTYYRSSYGEADWRQYNLRQPPRGYHYVRDDRGDFLLVALTTGIILGVILSNNR